MTKWDELTDEDKARLREVAAEQRADAAPREAELVAAEERAAGAIADKEAWEVAPSVLLWLLWTAVWLTIVGVLLGVAYLLYLWMQ